MKTPLGKVLLERNNAKGEILLIVGIDGTLLQLKDMGQHLECNETILSLGTCSSAICEIEATLIVVEPFNSNLLS